MRDDLLRHPELLGDFVLFKAFGLHVDVGRYAGTTIRTPEGGSRRTPPSEPVRYDASMHRILVVERDDRIRQALCAELAAFDIAPCSDSVPLRTTPGERPAAIVANAELADGREDVLSLAGSVPVVLVADSPSVAHAVDCMRRGAADYLSRPLAAGELASAVQGAIERFAPARFDSRFSPMVGSCPAMLRLFAGIEAAAGEDAPVLIHGESGTGKELAARAVHAGSGRRHAPLIALNCATLPDALVEAELFGRDGVAAGSRRGLMDAASGGTLFLKAIGELPMPAQTRLLRFLRGDASEDAAPVRSGSHGQHFDVRLIAATQHELQPLTNSGRFLPALLKSLRCTVLHVPPLRQRGDDIAEIASAVLKRSSDKLDKAGLRFAPGVLEALRHYAWPGNVRELENAVERAVIVCSNGVIDIDLLAISDVGRAPPLGTAKAEQERSSSLESYFIRFVLENQDQLTETELASQLGISRKSLWERRQRLNVPRRGTRKRGPRQAAR